MNNDNPAEMSNSDLEKDTQERTVAAKNSGNQEHVNKSTASEGDLKSQEADQSSIANVQSSWNQAEEKDGDDSIPEQKTKMHIGGLPDPEGNMDWEENDEDDDASCG